MTNEPNTGHWPATLAVFHDELNRQRIALQAKKSAIDSKSALLITGAGIVIGLVSSSPSPWTKASVVAGVLAAILGLAALWPRNGKELAPEGAFERWRGLDAGDVEIRTYRHKLAAHSADRKQLRRSGLLSRWGFVAFVVAILLAATSVLFT